MRFGHISAASRPRAVFYSTNRIYSASLTRLHARPASETPGYYRNLKPRDITGASSSEVSSLYFSSPLSPCSPCAASRASLSAAASAPAGGRVSSEGIILVPCFISRLLNQPRVAIIARLGGRARLIKIAEGRGELAARRRVAEVAIRALRGDTTE